MFLKQRRFTATQGEGTHMINSSSSQTATLYDITKPVTPSEMSYPTNKSKLFSSAHNLSNTLAPHRPTSSLSKSADDVPNTRLIPRTVGFEHTETYLVPLPATPPLTPPEIEYEDSSSSTSDNNSWSNDNYFPQATRQNANLGTEDIWTANTATSTDSYLYQPAEISRSSLLASPQTDDNNNASSIKNKNQQISPLLSPTEQNAYPGEIFCFDNSESNDLTENSARDEQSILGYSP